MRKLISTTLAAALVVVLSGAHAGAQVPVILTNDDGIDSIGIQAVYNALQGVTGIEVTVVAPAAEASGSGFGFNSEFFGLMDVTENALMNDGVSTGYAVDGKPADCIRWALKVLPQASNKNQVIVVSGSNRGQNQGFNIMPSGTVGGAGTATLLGVRRSIAVSQGLSIAGGELAEDIEDCEAGAQFVANIVQALVDKSDSVKKIQKTFEKKKMFLNINVPAGGAPVGAAVTKKIAPVGIVTEYAAQTPVGDTTPYQITFDFDTVDTQSSLAQAQDDKSDVGTVADNLISLSMLFPEKMIKGGGKIDDSLLAGVVAP